MPTKSVHPSASWLDRLPATVDRIREHLLAVILLGALVGVIGTAHVVLAPAGHLQLSLQFVLIGLWTLTTLLALAGAYASVVDHLDLEPRVTLEILPEDERSVLEPIIATPGVTQVEVVARSDYSDAKVSQTLKALRERGLVYREPQGRTYRLYPGTIFEGIDGKP